jgi:ABC-type phosphate transport system auxiliary subunit
MTTVNELFNKFVAKHIACEFAYHTHILEELIEERDEVKINLDDTHQRFAVLPTSAGQEEVDELKEELVGYDAELKRMNNVLSFVNGATRGYLLTKVVSTLEWEYQEPVHFTANAEIADLAFQFFNAHALITQQ